MTKLVIFDLDGTLIDSVADLGYAVNYALERLGYPIHKIESYYMMIGGGVRNLALKALPDGSKTPEEVERLLAHFFDYYNNNSMTHTHSYDGIVEMLNALQSRGTLLAVASNKYHAATVDIVSKIFPDIEFSAIYGQRDGVEVKPNPQIVYDILEDLSASKGDVLYVGDSGVDMATAKNGGLRSVGVTWGFRPESELVEHGANHIIHTPGELLSIAEQILPI